uniref:Uncharacterized protein n=1 Tax=Arundo donax TaxID=35708 RepID=A0A0A8ZCK6_ARUDO
MAFPWTRGVPYQKNCCHLSNHMNYLTLE